MGCWNGTCMISNLPITAGEPVVGYFVTYFSFGDERDYSGSCYPTSKACPISLPFYGTYDDYGGIESVDDNSIAIRYLLDWFKETSSSELLRSVERDERTIYTHRSQKESGVGLMLINRHVFDSLIDAYIMPKRNSWSVDKIISGLQSIRDYSKNLPSFLENLSNIENTKEIAKLLSRTNIVEQLGLHVDYLEQGDYTKMVEFVLNQDDNCEKEFAELLYKDQIIRVTMSKLRKLWIGPSGKGAQHTDYRTHLILAEAVRKHIFDSFDGPEDAYLNLLGEGDY